MGSKHLTMPVGSIGKWEIDFATSGNFLTALGCAAVEHGDVCHTARWEDVGPDHNPAVSSEDVHLADWVRSGFHLPRTGPGSKCSAL